MSSESSRSPLSPAADALDPAARLAEFRTDARFRLLVEQIQDCAIFLIAPDGRYASWNAGVHHVLGYEEAEFVGEPTNVIFTPEDVSRGVPAAELEQAQRHGKADDDRWMVRKGGTRFWASGVTTRLSDDAGRLLGFGKVLRDLTGQKALQDRLAASEIALRESEERLRQSQRIEAVGKLAGGVAHEVNNMMSVVIGFTDFLLDGFRPGDQRRKDLEQVRAAASRAARVTAQLLAFGRRQVLQPSVLRVGEIVETLRPVLSRLLGEDKELVVRQPADVAFVRADRGQLEQVIINLAINARDAMRQGGRLTIDTADVTLDDAVRARQPEIAAAAGAYVMLTMSDTGHGMDQATLDRIFEPFFTTKPTGQGTGLGLAVVHGIVHQSEGYILAESAPGGGTTFRVYLPVVSPTGERGSRRSSPIVARGSGETILVVEDETLVRDLVVRLLERLGYICLEARDGKEALDLLASRLDPVDLVLTDIVMPRMNGRELAGELSRRWPALPVLFMSGYTDDEMVRRDLLAPGAPFIQKPFDAKAAAAKLLPLLTER